MATEAQKKATKRYIQSPKGKERQKRYNQSPEGKTTSKYYRQSSKGKKAVKRAGLKYKYNLTLEQHEDMYLKQNGCCGICNKSIPYDKMDTDHNHKTNKVRGLLCRRCNHFTGYIDKYPELLGPIIDWIKNEGRNN